MAPTPCNPRLFFFAGGVCTNAFDQENESVCATLKDCCNANFDSGCCQFEDVCYNHQQVILSKTTPSEACYEPWHSKTYQVGDMVTGKDGKNYPCNADFFLYCSWAAFEPGTGSTIDYYKLAWDELPTRCHTRIANGPSPRDPQPQRHLFHRIVPSILTSSIAIILQGTLLVIMG
eukprot:CCRYP_013866-RB/>CCRYP_013866-RB protein AED:0.09 eAED:0.09 QI:1098/1/1/1/0.16/0/7/2325/174